jgi:hypothetical protein
MLVLAGLASGCQTGPTTTAAGDVTPNAVTGGVIEVTALDAPPAAAPTPSAAGAVAEIPAELAVAPANGAEAPLPEAEPLAAGTDPLAEPAEASAEAAAPEASAAEVAPPPPPKSELQIACERRRGTWEDTGGGLMVCIRPTRDGGKRCTRESQCEGLCLARSGTCSPLDPLLGCHDILQDNGARAIQCFE